MPTAGNRIILSGGAYGVLSSGAAGVFNASGECDECCGGGETPSGPIRIRYIQFQEGGHEGDGLSGCRGGRQYFSDGQLLGGGGSVSNPQWSVVFGLDTFTVTYRFQSNEECGGDNPCEQYGSAIIAIGTENVYTVAEITYDGMAARHKDGTTPSYMFSSQRNADLSVGGLGVFYADYDPLGLVEDPCDYPIVAMEAIDPELTMPVYAVFPPQPTPPTHPPPYAIILNAHQGNPLTKTVAGSSYCRWVISNSGLIIPPPPTVAQVGAFDSPTS